MNDIIFWKYKGGGYYKIFNYSSVANQKIGVMLGDNAVSSLLTPASVKDDITNDCRSEHGTRFYSINYYKERDVTLDLTIRGDSRSNYLENLNSLIDILNVGHLAVTIPKICGRAFFLNYQSFQTYALSRSGLISKISIKLKEYNPTKTAFVFASKAEMNKYVSTYGAIDDNVYGVSEEIVSNDNEHIII